MDKTSLLKLNKIWKKLALGAVMTVLFTMLFMNIIIQKINGYYAIKDFEADLDSMANVAIYSLEEPLWNLNKDSLPDICNSFFQDRAVSQILVKDKNLGILFEKKMEGPIHDEDLLITIEKDIYRKEEKIGSVALTMTKYYIELQNKRNSQIQLVEMLALMLLLSAILFLIITRITRPLSDLKLALMDIAEEEDRTPQIVVKSYDEIGELAESFNVMSQKIFEARRSIQQLNEALEQKVQVRTEELNEKNKELMTSLEVIKATEEELLASNQNLSQTLRELQEVQDLLVESGKMALLGELVAGVAHEINTPIGVSLTVSSFVEREVKRLLDKVRNNTLSKKDFLDFLEKMEESSGSIVRNLLRAGDLITSFKQVAVDQASHSVRKFNFHDYVDETLKNLHSQYKNRDIHIINQCPEDLTIVSYPGAYAQVITNFVMNSLIHAFDHDDSGTITIHGERIQDDFRLIFHDNGHGIPEEIVKKVFNPFFTTKRGLGGTGLGLNITYNIAVNILKGSIVCQSEIGQGTTFIMTVPFHHPDINEALY